MFKLWKCWIYYSNNTRGIAWCRCCFTKHGVCNTSVTNLISCFFWLTNRVFNVNSSSFFIPAYELVLDLLWRAAGAASFHFPKNPTDKKSDPLCWVCFCACECSNAAAVVFSSPAPWKPSNGVTQLAEASCTQTALCWKRPSQCPVRHSKARACVLFLLILSRQIVVSALCRKLASYPLFLHGKLFGISIALQTRIAMDSLKLSVSEASAFDALTDLCMKSWPSPVTCSLLDRRRFYRFLFLISQYNWSLSFSLHFSSQFYRGNQWPHLIFKLPTFLFVVDCSNYILFCQMLVTLLLLLPPRTRHTDEICRQKHIFTKTGGWPLR